MKKIFLVLVFLAPALFAQDLQSVRYKTLKFYNTSGTQVYKSANTTATGALDTVVSEFIPFDADEYRFSISCGQGDTAYANVSYQLVAGVNPTGTQPTNAGIYTRGGIAMAAKVDSLISLGVRQAIVGQTAKMVLTGHFLSTGHTSTAGGYQSNRDSTWTNTFGSGASTTGYSGFRVVIVFYAGPQDVSNTTLLTQNVLIIRRFD